MTGGSATGVPRTMRDEIKEVATELLIRHGYQGFRFREIADRLGTTRANIHYYFGSKQRLVDEVVCDYVGATLRLFEAAWNDDSRSLRDKIHWMMEFNRQRYLRYNPTGATGHPWSLIARSRLDRALVGSGARQTTLDFGDAIERLVRRGILRAIDQGELVPSTPVADVVLQLVAIVNSADPITQDAGSFARLEQLYLGFSRLLLHAYGAPATPRRGRRAVAPLKRATRFGSPRPDTSS
ncbi:MAG: TetR/AcrR family transcriptional regulator [Hyphomicrobiaceae bacterium]